MDITEVRAALAAGHHVTRNETTTFFLMVSNKKKYLFQRAKRPRTGEVVDSPSTMDWDDLNAMNWRIAQ